jgi:hypothetical protein
VLCAASLIFLTRHRQIPIAFPGLTYSTDLILKARELSTITNRNYRLVFDDDQVSLLSTSEPKSTIFLGRSEQLAKAPSSVRWALLAREYAYLICYEDKAYKRSALVPYNYPPVLHFAEVQMRAEFGPWHYDFRVKALALALDLLGRLGQPKQGMLDLFLAEKRILERSEKLLDRPDLGWFTTWTRGSIDELIDVVKAKLTLPN